MRRQISLPLSEEARRSVFFNLRSAALWLPRAMVHGDGTLHSVSLPAEIAGHEHSRDRARQLLERVGLAERAHHYPSQLSGGEQQRVAIARALAHSPRVLLADEPTGNLDLKTGARIIEMLFELNAETGSTMILVTHDTEIARRCERVFHLDNGRLIEDAGHALPG